MKTISKTISTTCLLVLVFFYCGCTPENSIPIDNSKDQVLVVTTDYQTGSYSTIELPSLRVVKNIQAIHPDAVCRYDPVTQNPYIVSRYGADAVEILDPASMWHVEYEFSAGAGTNPQDIAVVDQRAYIPRYSHKDLLVVDPQTGNQRNLIDLSGYADLDGIPETGWVVAVNDKIYVVLQRLENFEPTDYSSLVIIDAETGVVEDEKID